jgi:hypothetical protein
MAAFETVVRTAARQVQSRGSQAPAYRDRARRARCLPGTSAGRAGGDTRSRRAAGRKRGRGQAVRRHQIQLPPHEHRRAVRSVEGSRVQPGRGCERCPPWSSRTLSRQSWFFIGPDGHRLDENSIPPDASIILTNDQPYSRKINAGAKGFERYAPPGVVEKVRQAVLAKFGATISANVVYLHLEGAHVLQRDLRHIYKGRRYGAPRRDARAGMEITYPGVEFSPKRFS